MSTSETYRPEWHGGPPPQTIVRQDGAGNARWFHGMLATIKASAEETAGQLTAVEILAPAGAGSPLHVHHDEDEGFLVLEGEVTFEVGDAVVEAKAGDWLIGPREIPHRFTVGEGGARMFWTLTPGGFDRFVVAASEPAQALTVPPPFAVDEAGFAALQRLAAEHGITVYG
jgi:quercetin dioxygenase-like cupin family protein